MEGQKNYLERENLSNGIFGLFGFTLIMMTANPVITIHSLSLLVLQRRLGEIPFLKAPSKTTKRLNMVRKQITR
jgi:hypothetical protein